MRLVSRLVSISYTLACEEVFSGGAETSAFWGGGMSASVAASFPIAECSDSQL